MPRGRFLIKGAERPYPASLVIEDGEDAGTYILEKGAVIACPYDPKACLARIYDCCGVVSRRPLILASNITRGILCKKAPTQQWEEGTELAHLPDGATLIISGMLGYQPQLGE